jgi:putative ABC transport system ATP-binding protein
LDIYEGEIIVLLGRSGSGKSTLLNLIGGIDRPDSGSIIADGSNITSMKEKDVTLYRRTSVGFVFQFFNLIPTLNVLENILLPLELNDNLDTTTQQYALDLLQQVGLENRTNAFPDTLSGGEQQRVAIVRALIHDPAIILADEPTGNLDSDTGEQVLQILDTLVRDKGKTMLMVTHSPDVVGLADRVFSVHEGTLHQEHISSKE